MSALNYMTQLLHICSGKQQNRVLGVGVIKKSAIFSFTAQGLSLAKKIAEFIDAEVIENPKEVKKYIARNFTNCDKLVFVGAVGIAVRLIKDYITTKDKDPAVVVVDECGRFAIPLLSGHLGGANELAKAISTEINATPVITTATDINNKFAVDLFAKTNNMKIADISKIVSVSSAILHCEAISLYSDFVVQGEYPFEHSQTSLVGVSISLDDKKSPFDITLNLVPQIITLGVGCRKNTDPVVFENYILEVLEREKISILAIETIASIDIKSSEKAILDFAEKYGIATKFYSADELQKVEGEFASSSFVKSITGVDNVCERSAVCASGAQIILPKESRDGITVSLAKKDWKCSF